MGTQIKFCQKSGKGFQSLIYLLIMIYLIICLYLSSTYKMHMSVSITMLRDYRTWHLEIGNGNLRLP